MAKKAVKKEKPLVVEVFTSKVAVGLYRTVMYAIVEVLGSQALIALLENKVSDPLVYMVVLVFVMELRKRIKEALGEEHPVSKIL